MKKKKNFISSNLPFVKNKYFLTSLGFLAWLSFFDRNDFFTTWSYHSKLESLRTEKAYYEKQIRQNTQDLNDLMTNRKSLEKYAREKYYMKKDNEDIFVIIEKPAKD